MRIGYLGPEGTFTEEALIEALGDERQQHELIPLPTIYDSVIAVHERTVERALVPIENSLEGSVNTTLDALAVDTDDVEIVGEVIHSIAHCLIARNELALDGIETVVSHQQASAQCARFIREHLPSAKVVTAASTAEAVRMVAEHDGPWAALGNQLAAKLYRCTVLAAAVEDVQGNETRFVWIAPADSAEIGSGPAKTSLVFWGASSDTPGWLVRCLSEFAFRGVNLTRIESRPRKRGLGQYMFFIDLEGRVDEQRVAEAITGLGEQAEHVRVFGSYPGAS